MSESNTQNRLKDWLQELQSIGKRYRIVVAKRSDDKSARRIAILVGNSFLQVFSINRCADEEKLESNNSRLHFSGFMESDVYREAKLLGLHCLEIEEEERIRQLGRNGIGVDPLKLHPDTGAHNPKLLKLIFENLLLNSAGKQNGIERKITRAQLGSRTIRR